MARGLAFVNARIRTCDPREPVAEAMIVLDGRVHRLGDEAALRAMAARESLPILDLDGADVTPGIIDSHTHLVHQGLLRYRLDLREARSLPEALARVKKALGRHPAKELFLAERWDESKWPERRYPHREDLDNLSRTVPIILRRVDGHTAVGNGAAVKLLEGRTPGVDPESGLLLEEASLNLNQLFPTPLATSVDCLLLAQDQALALGVTAVHDFVVPSYLRAYGLAHQTGSLKIRAHLSLYAEYFDAIERTGFARGWGDDRLRFAGLKLFADGSFGGHTAALHQPYVDTGGTGRLNWTDAALATLIQRADAADLQVSAHAIGDAAIDQVARAYRALPRPSRARRHRIEHFELHTDASIDTILHHGLVASMQPNFVGEWCRPGAMYAHRLGEPRFRHTNEFRRLLKADVPLAFGSDCMPFDPWFGLESCVRAPYPRQRLTFDQALMVYTHGSAFGMGRERDLGMLRKGMQADFVVAELDPRRPTGTKVLATYVGGREAFRASRRKGNR